MAENAPPKIIIDSDWKSQAQAEKEKLAQAEREAAAKKAAMRPAAPTTGEGDASAGGPGQERGHGAGAGAGAGARGMPPADFQTLVGTMVTQAMMYLGAFPDESGRAMVSLEHARFYIDLIGVLEEKTKGNISVAEAEDIKQALYELRIRYVEITKAVEQAAKQNPGRKAGGVGGVGGTGPIGLAR